MQGSLSDRHVKMLNLGCDWLSFLLPHALRKVSRVHFGLLKPDEMRAMQARGHLPRSRRYLAVPFVGKDQGHTWCTPIPCTFPSVHC